MITDIFSDVLTHTHGLGFVDMVKIVSTEEETKIEAMDEDKTVVIYGKLNKPLTELQ